MDSRLIAAARLSVGTCSAPHCVHPSSSAPPAEYMYLPQRREDETNQPTAFGPETHTERVFSALYANTKTQAASQYHIRRL